MLSCLDITLNEEATKALLETEDENVAYNEAIDRLALQESGNYGLQEDARIAKPGKMTGVNL